MNTRSKTEFSRYTPDELRELYKKNPHHFDEIAVEAISQACIGMTPDQTIKRRQLQWTIDAQLQKAKTPLERMQVMENIFYGRVFGDEGELAHLVYSCQELLHQFRGNDRVPTKKPALYLVSLVKS